MAMHVPLAFWIVWRCSRVPTLLNGKLKGLGRPENARILETPPGSGIRASVNRPLHRLLRPSVAMQVKRVESLVVHCRHPKLHQCLGTTNEGWRVAEKFAPVDRHAATLEFVIKLKILGTTWGLDILAVLHRVSVQRFVREMLQGLFSLAVQIDEDVVRVVGIMDDDHADQAHSHVVMIPDGVIMVEPHARQCCPIPSCSSSK